MTSAPDKPRLLLVDYENVQQIELAGLDNSFRIIIFVGASQKNVPIELVKTAQEFGNRIEWQKVAGNGRNALDFFIACYLGRVFEKTPRPECFILSKDKGFDPLLRHLNSNGLKCRRLENLIELDIRTTTSAEPNYRRVIEVLSKSEKRSRPRKRKTLAQCISAMFQRRLSQKEVARIIEVLLANKMISETNNTITYEF